VEMLVRVDQPQRVDLGLKIALGAHCLHPMAVMEP
jgi:hypothetical protein